MRLVIFLLLVPTAAAHDEAAAPDLRSDVIEVGHAPEVPAPGTQWEGHILFDAGHNVTDVHYQICRVGQNCFAPRTPATPSGDLYSFQTQDYVDGISQRPVAWGIGDGSDWLVGYKFFLSHDDGSQAWFPQGIPHTACTNMTFVECDATHYFVFTIPGAQADHDAPAPFLILPLLAALLARRGRHE